jgi:DNA transformation protein
MLKGDPMPVTDDCITHTPDLLHGLGPLRIKRMFGGAGVYCGELFFAVLVDDQLYFKVDEANRGDYESPGLAPFGRTATMGYYPVPAEVTEEQEQLSEWAEKALQAARRKSGTGKTSAGRRSRSPARQLTFR